MASVFGKDIFRIYGTPPWSCTSFVTPFGRGWLVIRILTFYARWNWVWKGCCGGLAAAVLGSKPELMISQIVHCNVKFWRASVQYSYNRTQPKMAIIVTPEVWTVPMTQLCATSCLKWKWTSLLGTWWCSMVQHSHTANVSNTEEKVLHQYSLNACPVPPGGKLWNCALFPYPR